MNSGSRTVQIYFYSMDVVRTKKGADNTPYNIDAIRQAISELLAAIVKKDLQAKKHDVSKKKKVVWLDNVEDIGDGNFNLVFKSARYDQSREVRNTDTMEWRGILQNPEDGAEEKTHLCIRLRKGAERFTAVLESNSFGITITDIAAYLNNQFNSIQEDSTENYSYATSFELMLGEDFLIELDKMKKINLLRLTVDFAELGGDFQDFAGTNEIRSTVELYIRKERGKGVNIPKNLISNTYNQHKNANLKKQIKKIAVEGSNDSGNLKIDTDSIHMKHSIEIETLQPTNEVSTSDFFVKVSASIIEMGV